MVTDHRQSFRMDENLSAEDRSRITVSVLWGDEEIRRSDMRQKIFPQLPEYDEFLSLGYRKLTVSAAIP